MLKCSILALTLASAASLTACGLGSNALRGSDGNLAPCTGGPHCVSSTDPDPAHKVAPLSYVGTVDTAKSRIKTVIKADGAAVVSESADYIHATYTSSLMRYVDDVEFVFDTPGTIDIRSSSRIGYSDLGKNRERVEAIRTAFAATK